MYKISQTAVDDDIRASSVRNNLFCVLGSHTSRISCRCDRRGLNICIADRHFASAISRGAMQI